ncbi:MAG: CdaR family protein [Oscillospiraceae bacterium]|nr:CdaR family protein [Oscillospiraceae bacterium]
MQRSKIVMLLIALAASVGLWLYVVTVENPEDTATITSIPVIFAGEADLQNNENLIITSGAEATVTLKLTGKRSELKKLSRDNIEITVDLSRVTKAGEYKLGYLITYPADVNETSFTLDERKPGSLTVKAEELVTSEIPVKGVFTGDVAEGYMTEEMEFDYDQITIRGTAEAVTKVSYAQVILDQTDLTSTVTASVPYTLTGADGEPVTGAGVTANIAQINVTMPVVKFKSIPLTVDLTEGGGALAADANCVISPASVTLSGDAEILDGISKIVLGTIDLSQVRSGDKQTFEIKVPAKTKNVSGDDAAIVTVTFPTLGSATLRVSSIEFINVPKGFDAESMTQLLQATVRAPSDVIDKVTTNNLRAVADLGSYTQEGTYTVPVTVYVDGYPEAGVVGAYTIVLSLAKQ